MILSPHIITGAALGANLHNPYLLPFGAMALHHLLDKTPHYDYQIKPFSSRVALKIFLDISIGTSLILFIYLFINPTLNLLYTFTGMLFGTLPDAILLASFIFYNNTLLLKYQKFHSLLHFRDKTINEETDKNLAPKEIFKKRFSWPRIFTQLAAIIVALYFLL